MHERFGMVDSLGKGAAFSSRDGRSGWCCSVSNCNGSVFHDAIWWRGCCPSSVDPWRFTASVGVLPAGQARGRALATPHSYMQVRLRCHGDPFAVNRRRPGHCEERVHAHLSFLRGLERTRALAFGGCLELSLPACCGNVMLSVRLLEASGSLGRLPSVVCGADSTCSGAVYRGWPPIRVPLRVPTSLLPLAWLSVFCLARVAFSARPT